jgi:hypothetical protein
MTNGNVNIVDFFVIDKLYKIPSILHCNSLERTKGARTVNLSFRKTMFLASKLCRPERVKALDFPELILFRLPIKMSFLGNTSHSLIPSFHFSIKEIYLIFSHSPPNPSFLFFSLSF